MELFKNKYVELIFDTENSIFEETFTPETEFVEWEDLQKYWTLMAEYFMEYKPKYNLTNAKNLLFPINNENQIWIDENVANVAAQCLSKKAMVMSSDFMSQLSIQLTLEEGNASAIPIKYFETREEAIDWLLNS